MPSPLTADRRKGKRDAPMLSRSIVAAVTPAIRSRFLKLNIDRLRYGFGRTIGPTGVRLIIAIATSARPMCTAHSLIDHPIIGYAPGPVTLPIAATRFARTTAIAAAIAILRRFFIAFPFAHERIRDQRNGSTK